ncbi:MAG: hypothetical protein RIC19_12710 [Phaeodactylibacter sp.]|uniref:hypothetical protein n=1 Tax=Phaeodactylibacter sp. TaxID=1940289 RepID=UPI0032EDA108
MKQLLYFIALSVVVFLTSCSSNEEELWIEADGSGRYESTMDLSGVYPFLLMGLNSESEEEGEEKDPFTQMMEGLLQSESADTLINFTTLVEREMKQEGRTLKMLLDSLQSVNPEEAGITEAEKQTNIDMINNLMGMQLRMQVDRSAAMFKITTITRFDDITNFERGGDLMSTLMEMRGAEAAGPQTDMLGDALGAQTLFSLNGKTLNVSRRGEDAGDMSEEDRQQMEMMEGMLGDEPYRLTIHFPGKVKKRLNSQYATRVDNQTVVIEIPQEDLKNPDLKMDLGIKFKGLK